MQKPDCRIDQVNTLKINELPNLQLDQCGELWPTLIKNPCPGVRRVTGVTN